MPLNLKEEEITKINKCIEDILSNNMSNGMTKKDFSSITSTIKDKYKDHSKALNDFIKLIPEGYEDEIQDFKDMQLVFLQRGPAIHPQKEPFHQLDGVIDVNNGSAGFSI
jgi:hypothetical protein